MSGGADLRSLVRDVPDFPKPGIAFKDITPLLGDATGLAAAVEGLAGLVADAGLPVDRVLGIEARGFILAAPLAVHLGVGFAPVRKPGKLPWQTVRQEYELEYGTDALEVHRDAVLPGERVLIVDDVIATGGTAAATARLASGLGAEVVGLAVLVELVALAGRDRLGDHRVLSLLEY